MAGNGTLAGFRNTLPYETCASMVEGLQRALFVRADSCALGELDNTLF